MSKVLTRTKSCSRPVIVVPTRITHDSSFSSFEKNNVNASMFKGHPSLLY
jgi:hypothetical protein